MLPFDNAPASNAFPAFGVARQKAFLSQLQAKKALEKEMAMRAEIESGRIAVQERERGFQGYWQGANAVGTAGRGTSSSRTKLRGPVAVAVPVVAAVEAAPSRTRTRRRWDVGTPVLLKITDGDEKGEILHLAQQPAQLGGRRANAATQSC